jgi:hypothetical protein
MENLKDVLIPDEMRFRTEELSKYSKPELAAHLYVANLLGAEGKRINEFTIRNMRIQSGKCVMTCLRKDEGRWGEADVEGLEHAHCDAELVDVHSENNIGVVREESAQMEVSVPLHILRAIEERCKIEIEMLSRDVFRKTGEIIMDAEAEERKKRAANDDEEKMRMAA